MDKGVTLPRGFLAGVGKARIKGDREDVALIYSQTPATAAGVFTRNLVRSAPVELTATHLGCRDGSLRAVVANSGNANACNGQEGMAAARRMAGVAAAALGLAEEEVAVASTGVVGMPFPIAKVEEGIAAAALGLSREGGAAAARAIMTTDTFSKETAATFTHAGRSFRLGGMAKGSGMIHPDMATMLAFLTTDACVTPGALRATLAAAVERTFNAITVDGDTSPNDTVLILANGGGGGEEIDLGSPGLDQFAAALEDVCRDLARQIARDGEGATCLLEVRVEGTADEAGARRIARTVARSPLVKAAVHGRDPNWGRILVAAGYAGVPFDPAQTDVFIGAVPVARGGLALPFDEAAASRELAVPEVRLRLVVGGGGGAATAWGCDLSAEYVRINADYRS